MTDPTQRKHVLNIRSNEKSPGKIFGGSDRADFNNFLINETIGTGFFYDPPTPERHDAVRSATVVGMMAFKPADEIEGMIAAQAMAMHHATMELARRAMIPEQPQEIAQSYRKAAANMSRTFVGLLDALDRKRGKTGQQKVTVEHVHVHAGGQAIVGSVAPAAGGGGGVAREIEDKPLEPPARLAHDVAPGAVMPPLWREESSREPVPVAIDAREVPVPAARRRQHRPPHA